jgi:hypothetical protein
VKLRIEQDTDAEDPRESYDHLGKMVCFHRRYNLGDKHDFESADYDGWEELEAAIQKEENPVVILPLYLYDHSGLTINTTGFSCSFDSGQIGFVYATREDVLKEYSKKRISNKLRDTVAECLRSEVKSFDQFITGDVWYYVIEDDNGEVLDSCCGFYGREYCEQEAQEALEYLEDQERAKPPTHIPAPVCATA